MKYHDKKACAGQACCIHNPSDHIMKDWPLNRRESMLMERICPHGIGHPDPDSLTWMERNGRKGYGVHDCDGCCTGKRFETQADIKTAAAKSLVSFDELCPNCDMRKGTMLWSGDLRTMMALRMMGSLPKWCELCVAREQLKRAQELAATVPELEKKIAKLLKTSK